MRVIGVLGLQGAIQEHVQAIEACGETALVVKEPDQLQQIDALVLPGGESTTMRHLIDKYHFLEPLRAFSAEEKPILGTCAGMILLANYIVEQKEHHIGVMDIKVARNSYGRQRDSFEVNVALKNIATDFPAVFIRAPHIQAVGEEVEVLAEHEGRIVAAQQNHLLAVSFHPELTTDYRLMKYFISLIDSKKVKTSV